MFFFFCFAFSVSWCKQTSKLLPSATPPRGGREWQQKDASISRLSPLPERRRRSNGKRRWATAVDWSSSQLGRVLIMLLRVLAEFVPSYLYSFLSRKVSPWQESTGLSFPQSFWVSLSLSRFSHFLPLSSCLLFLLSELLISPRKQQKKFVDRPPHADRRRMDSFVDAPSSRAHDLPFLSTISPFSSQEQLAIEELYTWLYLHSYMYARLRWYLYYLLARLFNTSTVCLSYGGAQDLTPINEISTDSEKAEHRHFDFLLAMDNRTNTFLSPASVEACL